MFKKYYKDANDDIQTNRELIDKIFEEAEKPSKKKAGASVYKFSIVMAAVLVLAISIGSVMNFTKKEGINIPENSNAPIAIVNDDKPEPTEKQKPVSEPKKSQPEKIVNDEMEETPGIQPIEVEENAEAEGEDEGQIPVLAMETNESGESVASRKGIAEETQSTNNEISVDLDDLEAVSQAEANVIKNMFVSEYGETDEETGFMYGYFIEGKAHTEDGNYYLVRMSWLVEDHWSTVQTFALNEAMNGLYFSVHSGNSVYWSTEQNQLNL